MNGGDYSLFQKECTMNSDFFCGPLGEGDKNSHGRLCKQGFYTCSIFFVQRDRIYNRVNFWPPSTRGGTKKFGIKCAFLMEQRNDVRFGGRDWGRNRPAQLQASWHPKKFESGLYSFRLSVIHLRHSSTHSPLVQLNSAHRTKAITIVCFIFSVLTRNI